MPPSTGIAAPADTREVTHPPTRRNCSRRILPFTRHPKLLARAARLQIQACAVRVLCLLLTTADDDGVSWVSPREMCRLLPRSGKVKVYSLPQVLRSLRQLRDLGLIVWDRLAPMTCFPARVEGVTVAAQGRFTSSGGRVWRVMLDTLRTAPVSSNLTTARPVLGAIMHDRSGAITYDRPSDRSDLRSDLQMDPAGEAPGVENEAGETPSVPAPAPMSEPRALSSKPAPTSRTLQVASETPRVAAAIQPTRDAQAPPQSREELQRGSSRANETPASPEPTTDVRQIAADLAWLYEPGKHPPPPGTRTRKPC